MCYEKMANVSILVKMLCDLYSENYPAYKGDLEKFYKEKYEKISQDVNCTFDDIAARVFIINSYDYEETTYEWKYICLSFYLLELLNDELSKSKMEVLSVQETKNVKSCIKHLINLGIQKNIQPNLPSRLKIENHQSKNIIYNYIILKCTTYAFSKYMKYPNLRMLILPHSLQEILVAVYQLAYCPLKKPTSKSTQNQFVMSEEKYNKFLLDQELFKTVLENMRQNIHPAIFVKETMILFQTNTPMWFKKAVSNTLTSIIRSKKGIEYITLAMLDGSADDTTKTWKVLDILTKLIISCRKFPDFRENICVQLTDLLDSVKSKDLFVFERLVVCCTKSLYCEDKELCTAVFLSRLMAPLLHFTSKEHKFRDGDVVTDDIKQTIRLVYESFVHNSVNLPCLPMEFLKTAINVIFYFYHLSVKSKFEATTKELKEILIKYLQCCTSQEIDQLFDSFLFGFAVTDVPLFRNDIIVEIDKEIVVKCSQHTVIYTTADTADSLFNLLRAEQKILLFGYLLKCITEKEKYFQTQSNQELLSLEGEAASPVLERLLSMHKLLSQLSEDKEVQSSLKTKPDNIITYIHNVFLHTIKNDTHKSSTVNEISHSLFIIVMILENLVLNSSKKSLVKYQVLLDSLLQIARETPNNELKAVCYKIISMVREQKIIEKKEKEITEVDKALEDLCDRFLPVRGHALLTLSKLVEKKDKNVMEKKQYLLNLFQLHLKDEDSYIYLNAVRGLAALADVFPDTVLEVLCEEFADFTKKSGDDGHETRMKLGEVLVRIIKLLGEMAPKYKALLLNTFLTGTKDDDHLIRSSSLSNLGEVCQVLGYKLGTIITEVLVCVHAVIATDKAVEARRAAVTVIRQLFVGLESEMIAFLKEDILPIYRTLKEIYYNDKDDVMRLQAQLALEELNENVKSVIFPKPQLHTEKKVILMD